MSADAQKWTETGFSEQDRSRWVAAGVDDPASADAWRSNGFSAEQASAWLTAGVRLPTSAYSFRTLGIGPEELPEGVNSPQQWVFTHLAGVPPTGEWASLLHAASPGFVRIGFESGQSVAVILALAAALYRQRPGWGALHPQYHYRSVKVDCVWDEARTRAFEDAAARLRLSGLDWTDAATCLRAGLSIDETVAHLREGRDMEPIRTMEALNRPH